MSMAELRNVTCVAVGGRAILIEGEPGSGKSSLALALIDRGAVLVGDDGIVFERHDDTLIAAPPPAIAGKLEIRNIGIVKFPSACAPLCLRIVLDETAPRFIDDADEYAIEGVTIPSLALNPHLPHPHLRAEWALRAYGRTPGPSV